MARSNWRLKHFVRRVISEQLEIALHYHTLAWSDFDRDGEFKHWQWLVAQDEKEARHQDGCRRRWERQRAVPNTQNPEPKTLVSL